VDFITQENFMSWPTSHFMQKYGQYWLRANGYNLSLPELQKVILLTIGFAAFWLGVRFGLASVLRKQWLRAVCIGGIVVLCTIAFCGETSQRLDSDIAMLIFPRQMVFLVALVIPLAGYLFWHSSLRARKLATLVVASFGPLLAFRILFGMNPWGYAIYYNGPVLLSFIVLLLAIAIPGSHVYDGPGVRRTKWFLCAVVCGWVTLLAVPRYFDLRNGRVALESERGTIYVRDATMPAWADALDFMQ